VARAESLDIRSETVGSRQHAHTVQNIEDDSNEIASELAHLFSDTKELDQQLDYDKPVEVLVERHQQNQVDTQLQEQRVRGE